RLVEAQRQGGSQGGVTGMPRRASDREAIEAEIAHVRSLGLDALRTLWRLTFRSAPPPAFTKDLMARFLAGTFRSRPSAGLIRRPQSISTASPRGTSREWIAPGASSPAPSSCANTRASGTPLLLLQTAMSGTRRPMPVSRPSRGPSPGRAGTDRASSACGVAASQRLRWTRPMCRRHQRTSDVLFGRPSRRRLALHNILVTALLQHLSSVMGSADHEACRSQAPTLRDLHPQIDRAQSRSGVQLARCPEGSLRGLYQELGA